MSCESKLITIATHLEEIDEYIKSEAELIAELQDVVDNIPSDSNGSYDEGFVDGRQAEYDAFWDAYQKNGTRGDYQYAFTNEGWNDDTFKPKYNIVLKAGYGGTNMFWGFNGTDIAKSLEESGVILDTSICQYFQGMFQNAKCNRVPTLDFSKAYANSSGALSYIFSGSQIETIDKIIVAEGGMFNNSFNNCSNLTNVIFEGIISTNGLNLQWSTKLSKASIESIINCLSTNTSGLSITLSKTAVDNAFTNNEEWESLIATKENWTINLI